MTRPPAHFSAHDAHDEPRAGGLSGVGVVFAVLALLFTGVLILRAGAWTRFTPLQAVTAVAFDALLVLLVIATRRSRAPRARFAGRFAANRAAVAGAVVLVAMTAMVVLAPVISGDPADMGAGQRYAAPGGGHPLGTDRFGRDVWARVAHGGEVSLALCIMAVGLGTLLGVLIGTAAGTAGRRTDDVLMRVVDGMLSFPRILLLLMVAALAAPGVWTLGISLAATGWMGIARIVRGEVRRMREREFVDAAIASGVGKMGLVWRHLLPNTVGPVVVAATLNAGTVILLESSLSFLGFGVQPPTPSWGAMVFEGRDALHTAWWVSAWPALAITLAAAAFNLVGDGLRDAFNARASSGAAR
ncbi:MAG TPA: ABC transporter permease [Candidatus Krumholzibacteria bacterium]|nr:ABC transporter permease [Candidatus Krumholzibacteria bacterium]